MAISSLQLDAFLAVAQALSFTKAAKALHLTQSALSQRVMNLEKELETTLLIRDRSGLRLTEAGQDLVRYGRCKNSLEEEFLSKIKGGALAGTVRIGGFSSVMQSVLLPSMAKLLADHPLIKLQMVVDEMAELPARLQRGEIDYMITDIRQEKEGLERILLGKEKNVLVQKRKYRGPDIYLDHDEHDRVSHEYLKASGRRPKHLERRYLGNVYGILEGVRLGLGRGVIPMHLMEGEKDFEIVGGSTVLETPVYLYFYAQPFYSKLHSALLDAIHSNAPLLLAKGL